MEAMLVAHGFAETNDVEVWPENWRVWGLFMKLCTQWRYSFSGPTGLDYAAVYPLLDRTASSSDDWHQLFDDLRVIELAARQRIREQQEQE